jgi:hypothetical protein
MDGSTNARPDGVPTPPPPSGPRRAVNVVDNNNNNSSTLAPPPAIRRRPSCQIQRNWDRGEATNNSSSAYDSSTASAAAAAARRRSATIASPMREYPPPHLTLQTSRMTNRNHVNQPPPSSNQFQGEQAQEQDIGEGVLSTHHQHQQARSAYPASPAAPPHIRIADQDTPSRNSHYGDSSLGEGEATAGDTDKPTGWAGALMKSGRRRAATVSAALGMSPREQPSPSSYGLGHHHYNNEYDSNNLQVPGVGDNTPSNHNPPSSPRPSNRRGSRASFLSSPSTIDHFGSNVNPTSNARNEAYDTQVHDLLDVIDPEVQTVNLLGDFQNAFFIPPNRLFDRTRKLQLTKPPESKEAIKYTPPRTEDEQAAADARRAERLEAEEQQQQQQGQPHSRRPSEAEKQAQGAGALQTEGRPATIAEGEGDTSTGEEVTSEKPLPGPPAPLKPEEEEATQLAEEAGIIQGPATATDIETIELAQQKYVKGRYFVLPSKLVDMSDWSEQEKADLDDYVRHLLHSKKEIFRRRWRGFKKYVRTREFPTFR